MVDGPRATGSIGLTATLTATRAHGGETRRAVTDAKRLTGVRGALRRPSADTRART